MALLAAGIFEIRQGGSDANSGYFHAAGSSPGTDYTQQDAAQETIDGATITAVVHTTTTQLNLTGTTVSAAWNRNSIRISGGTATVGVYEITAVDVPNNRVTLDRAAGTAAQTATGTMGGAFASFGIVTTSSPATGNVAYIKNGTYTLTTATSDVSGGPWNTNIAGTLLVGYDIVRGDLNDQIGSANRPVISVGVLTSITVFVSSTNRIGCANVVVDGESNSTITAYSSGNYYNCTAIACTSGYVNTARAAYCSAESCTNGFNSTGQASYCLAKDCTLGFGLLWLVHCVSINNTTHVAGGAGTACTFINCTFHDGSGDVLDQMGIRLLLVNSVLTDIGGFGVDFSGAVQHPSALLVNVKYRNITGGMFDQSPPTAMLTQVAALTADPYDAEPTDLQPNSVAGGGAVLRGAMLVFAGALADNRDIGALQHTDPAGGSGMLVHGGMSGGMRA